MFASESAVPMQSFHYRRIVLACALALALVVVSALPARADGGFTIPEADYDVLWQRYAARDAAKPPAAGFPYMSCFNAAAERFELPVTLLLSVTRAESYFNPKAASGVGGRGLMQLTPATARDMGVSDLEDLFDPCINIQAGARYLKLLTKRYNQNLHKALAAYNYGMGRISVGGPPELMPEMAQWYSGYVYHHLGKVLAEAEDAPPEPADVARGKIKLIHFHSPDRAAGFLKHFRNRLPEVRLDLFQDNLERYYIYLMYDTESERDAGIGKMKKNGYDIDLNSGS